VTPLVTNPGRVVLTNARVYFQPYNNVDPDPVSRYNLPQIIRVIKRRHLLRQVVQKTLFSSSSSPFIFGPLIMSRLSQGIELFMKDGSNVFFSFADQVTRDKLMDTLLNQPGFSFFFSFFFFLSFLPFLSHEMKSLFRAKFN